MLKKHADSFVLIFPLLLAYELGVLIAGRVNGADLVSRLLYRAGMPAYLLVHAALTLAVLVWIRRTGRAPKADAVASLALESALYALSLSTLLALVMSISGPGVVGALGAGVHEELVFRLALYGGLVALLKGGRWAIAAAVPLSAVAFSLAHHPLTWHDFTYRVIAGVAFALIYQFRSLAHAVYTHTLYDLVILLR